MPEEKPNQNQNNIDEAEINKLRSAVLKWVEAKSASGPAAGAKAKPAPPKTKPQEIAAKKDYGPTKREAPKTGPVLISPASPALTKQKPALGVSQPKKTNRRGKKRLYQILALIIIIALLALIIFGLSLYYFKWQNSTTELVTKIIPYPVAFVDFRPLSYHEWQKQTQSLINFYNQEKINNPDLPIPSLKDTQTHILNRMIEQAIVNQLAKKYNIKVTAEEINQQTQDLIAETGSQELLAEQLQKLYRWSIADFEQEIIAPLLLKEKLRLAITLDDRLNHEARTKAEEILAKIKTGQNSFEEMARQFSEDVTALQGGDLGYFGRGQMVKEFEEAVFSLKPGEVSDIVKTQFGYHLIKVEEVLTDDNGQTIQARARHILIRGKDLDSYLEELKNQKRIWRLIKITNGWR